MSTSPSPRIRPRLAAQLPMFVLLCALALAATTSGGLNGSTRGPAPAPRAVVAAGLTYYVAPTGLDSNDGSPTAPWRTLRHAALTVRPGDTVIFEDGAYEETSLARFATGGTAEAPITLKARNRRSAHIHFIGNLNAERLRVDKPYITIRDFDFSGDDWTSAGTAIGNLVAVRAGGDNVRIIGNQIHHVYEDALKASNVTNLLADGNELFDVVHEGFDSVDITNSTVRNNVIRDVGRVGVLAKGGARNVRMYNNLVRDPKAAGTTTIAYALGGSTGSLSTYDLAGSEGYNLVAQNNVAIAGTGTLTHGILMQGCRDCGAFNNVIIGARYGLTLASGGDPVGSYGQQPWTAPTRNPTFQNNIVTDCVVRAVLTANVPDGILALDYNAYYRCPYAPRQAHAVTTDPLFVNSAYNWHLRTGSPAANVGLTLNTYPVFTDANTPAIAPFNLKTDRYGFPRIGRWDIGAYNFPG